MHRNIDLVLKRRDFYKNHYRSALTALIVCQIILFLLLAGIVYKLVTRPPVRFYATSTYSGEIIPLKGWLKPHPEMINTRKWQDEDKA